MDEGKHGHGAQWMRAAQERGALSASERLEERTRWLSPLGQRQVNTEGRYVLYWMATALRSRENPAFERAALASRKLGRPLVVYRALSARYRYASDRIHRFVLEGEAELRAAIEARGAIFVSHLDDGRSRVKLLDALASDACVVVVEDFPTFDVRGWTERFAARTPVPVVAVDAACVVPMRLVGRAFDRAFEFRKQVKPLWSARLEPLPVIDPFDMTPSAREALQRDLQAKLAAPPGGPKEAPQRARGEVAMGHDRLPMAPEAIPRLPIDHTVPPAPDLRGGMAAAQARWEQFKARSLATYTYRRNDALDDDGVSLLSPYLHFGMIWAGRVAREALAAGDGAGTTAAREAAEKYVDELLVWRELAWSFCFYRPDHGQLSAVPAWAREALEARAPTFDRPTLLQLDRGTTGDALWDAAQRRLRRDGWLHNNVRMTWGKQIVAWIREPERALAIAEELNHRYALDGRDPSSYGGILWCFGAFDRPHEPSADMGRVRPRPTAVHARRLSPERYGARAVAPHPSGVRVAIVGAGLAGLACARVLEDAGLKVLVVDKGSRAGGRLATRRTRVEALRRERRFDYGAPHLDARSPSFLRELGLYVESGLGRWASGVAGRFEFSRDTASEHGGDPDSQPGGGLVESPGLRHAEDVAFDWARGLDLRTHARVVKVERGGSTGGFRITVERETADDGASGDGATGDGTGQDTGAGGPHVHDADIVILACPAPQAAALVADLAPEAARRLDAVTYASIETRIFEGPGGALERKDEMFVATSDGPVTAPTSGEEVMGSLRHQKHWRYARCTHPLPDPFLDALGDGALLICGDGFRGASVGASVGTSVGDTGGPGESVDDAVPSGADEAFTSGTAAAARVLSVWRSRRALPSPVGVR